MVQQCFLREKILPIILIKPNIFPGKLQVRCLRGAGRLPILAAGLFVFVGIAGCLRHPSSAAPPYRPPYTQQDVVRFVSIGTDIHALIKRFGAPISVTKTPALDDGGSPVDEIDDFVLPPPPPTVKEYFAFCGFEAYLKNGKLVHIEWIHRDSHPTNEPRPTE
jgi:hypothetical protein